MIKFSLILRFTEKVDKFFPYLTKETVRSSELHDQ